MEALRSLISNIILEGMTKPSDVADKYALWTDLKNVEDFKVANFVMYDWRFALKQMEEILEYSGMEMLAGSEIVQKAITDINENGYSPVAAVMRVEKIPDYGECNFAWQVTRAAAEGGLGPTLYDIVMSISPFGIVSDRNSVSQSARNVYDFYANKRPEIEKRFLDDHHNSLTPSPHDDCEIYTMGNQRIQLKKATRDAAYKYIDDFYPNLLDGFLKDYSKESWSTDHGIDIIQGFMTWDSEGEVENWFFDNWEDYLNDYIYLDHDYESENFESPEYLNLSYNTRYAVPATKTMIKNHVELHLDFYPDLGLDNALQLFTSTACGEAVSQFFHRKYNPRDKD